LDYDGKTRYRKVNSLMDERIHYISLAEGVCENVNQNGINEHINKYVLNDLLVKEICSYMNPNLLPLPTPPTPDTK
jgi:hypothetical protein